MCLSFLLLILNCYYASAQNYLFNGNSDTVLYKNVCNGFYIKTGVPMSMDGAILIYSTEDPRVYAVKVNQLQQTEQAIIYILTYLQNPETHEQEKVFVDKLLVPIVEKEIKDSLCIENLSQELNPEGIELKFCGGLNRGLKILEYELIIDNKAWAVKSNRLTDELRSQIFLLEKGNKITIKVTYKDLLNNSFQLTQFFTK